MSEELYYINIYLDKLMKRCGVTKTISPPTIKLEPLEVILNNFLLKPFLFYHFTFEKYPKCIAINKYFK